MIIYHKSGEVKIPVKKLKSYMKDSCKICGDLTAMYSDISVGSIASKEGWSTVIIRTDRGLKLFENAVNKGYLEVSEIIKENLSLLDKLMKIKALRSKKST